MRSLRKGCRIKNYNDRSLRFKRKMQRTLMFVGCYLAFTSAPASAQIAENRDNEKYSTEENEVSEQVIYEQPVEFSGNLRVRVQLNYLKARSKATLSLLSPSKEVLGEVELPSWIMESRYHYDVQSGRIDHFPIILFKAEPATPREAESQSTYSVAWLYVEKGKYGKENQDGWKLITSTVSSFLDGGAVLELRKMDNRVELIRKKAESSTVCGLGNNAFDLYNPHTHSFVSQLNLGVLKGAMTLQATLPTSPYSPEHSLRLGYFHSASSSAAKGGLSNDRPREVNDGSELTFWNEGSPDLGQFQYLEAKFLPGAMFQGIRIIPGAFRNAQTYDSYARPTQLLVSTAEGKRYVVNLPLVTYKELKEKGGLIIHFPKPISTSCASVVILQSQSGDKPKTNPNAEKTAITEMTFLTPYYRLDRKIAAREIVNQVIQTNNSHLQRQLTYLSERYLDEITAEVRKRLQEGVDSQKLLPLINNLADKEAIGILVPLFTESSPDAKNYSAIIKALSAHGNLTAQALYHLYQSGKIKEPRQEMDLIRLIGRTGSDQMLQALIPHIGNGTQQLRNVIIRSIGRCSSLCMQPLLDQLGESDPQSMKSYDTLRVIRLVARNLQKDEVKALNIKPLQNTMLQSHSRRSLLLVMRILQQLTPPGYESALIKYLTYSRDPLVRSQAAATLGYYHSNEARDALLKGLDDKNPDVRIASIRALKERNDTSTYMQKIYDYSLKEHWRTGLAQAYALLTREKDPIYLTKLENQIRKNPTSERTDIILNSFSKVSYSIDFYTLSKIVENPSVSANIIRRAIDLLGRTKSPDALTLLSKLAGDKFVQELSPRQRHSLVERAILAIGRLDQPASIDFLFSTLHDMPNEDYRKALLRALSFSKDPSVIPRIEEIMKSLSQENQEVAKSVISHIRQRIQIENLVDHIGSP